MREPTSVTVQIFGQPYTLRGGADSAYVQEVAAFVDKRMKEVAKNASATSTTKIAILAAVNIADELLRQQRQDGEALSTLENKSEQIALLLDKEMGKDLSGIQDSDSLPGT